MIGVVLGGINTIIVDRTIYQKKYREALAKGKSHVEPEHRLYTAMIGGSGMVIGLFWFGWCADQGVHWAPTVLGVIPFAWGNICVFVSRTNLEYLGYTSADKSSFRHLLCCILRMYMARRMAHQL
jgi:hypothetical protein